METRGLELEGGGKSNSRCFCVSIFALMAFLPSLYFFLGLAKLPLFPSKDLLCVLYKLCSWEWKNQSFLVYLTLGAAIKGIKYFWWIKSCF